MKINFRRKAVRRVRHSEKGMTLIELVIVVVIIGIISSIAVARYQAAARTANQASAISGLKLLVNVENTHKSGQSFGSIDELIASGAIDESFSDSDGNPMTGDKSGYIYAVTFLPDNFIVSARPSNVNPLFASGAFRYGSDRTGVIYKDNENLETDYTTLDSLKAGTSVIAGNEE